MPAAGNRSVQDQDRPETIDEKASRLANEAKLLDEAREDIKAGRYLSGAALETWLERFAAGDNDLISGHE